MAFLLGCLAPVNFVDAGELLLEEDFDAYAVGPVALHGDNDVNRNWYTFDSADSKNGFSAVAEVVDDPDREGRSLRILARVRPETEGPFWIGVRRPIELDLGGLDPSRLKLTAQARVAVRQYDPGHGVILPQNVSYALRMESIKKLRPRGVRQFDLLGTPHFAEIGGLLEDAEAGGRIGHFDLRFFEGRAPYQVVLVLSSCCIDPEFQRGNYDVEVLLDDVRLEVVDPEVAAADVDRCRY